MSNDDKKKRCPKCKQWKDLTTENWYKMSGRAASYCKPCARLVSKLYKEEQARENIKHPPAIPDYKYCTKCKGKKEICHFASNVRSKDGLGCHCFNCRQKYYNQYYRNGAQLVQKQQAVPVRSKKHDGPQPGFVYIIQLDCFFKIGISVNYKRRISAINNMTPYKVELILSCEVQDMPFAEMILHATFENKRLESKREWFRLSPDDIKLSEMILNDLTSLTSSDISPEGYTLQLTLGIGNTHEISEA